MPRVAVSLVFAVVPRRRVFSARLPSPLQAEAEGRTVLPAGLLVRVLSDDADPRYTLIQWGADDQGWISRYLPNGASALV